MRGIKSFISKGAKFNDLTIIEEVPKRNGIRHFLCLCSCGKESIVSLHNLKNGGTKSCGCLQVKHTIKINSSHMCTKERLYKTWLNMKRRCNNSRCHEYANYGGRGISICNEWNFDFINFKSWAVNNGYDDDLTIERVDVNGNYCPENCKWIPMPDQLKNKRTTMYLTLNGVKKHASEWSRNFNLSKGVISYRKNNGWSDFDTLTTPVNKKPNKIKIYD